MVFHRRTFKLMLLLWLPAAFRYRPLPFDFIAKRRSFYYLLSLLAARQNEERVLLAAATSLFKADLGTTGEEDWSLRGVVSPSSSGKNAVRHCGKRKESDPIHCERNQSESPIYVTNNSRRQREAAGASVGEISSAIRHGVYDQGQPNQSGSLSSVWLF